MKTKLFLFFFFCYTIISSAQTYDERLTQIDIQHYNFMIELSDKTDEIIATAEITIRFLKPTKKFQLDLVKKKKGKGMIVKNITTNNHSLSFKHKKELLTIKLKTPAKTRETKKFIISYKGVPADGLVISKNEFGDRCFFGDNWPNRAHHWLPTIDHPADKSTVEFKVIAPMHYQIIANGEQIEESNLDDKRKITHWKTDVVLPTKVMVIGAADFAVQRAGKLDGIPISSWIFHEQREKGFADYSDAVKVLKFFTNNLATYPYQKLANVQSKTRYGGMENASCIFYYEASVQGNKKMEALIAHEVAHQWFGNSASEANWHHIWLSEGFATYWTNLYFEQTYDRDTFVNRLITERDQVIAYPNAFQNPIVDTNVKNLNKLLNTNSYQKGSWILHMLRKKIGDTAFFEGIKKYYQQYKYNNALTDDFRKVMETVSGTDLSLFFQQWFYTPGHPQLKTSWIFDNNKLTFHIEQKQKETIFQFPLEMAFYFENKKTIFKQFDINKKEQQFSIELTEKPKEIKIDPNVWLLWEEVK